MNMHVGNLSPGTSEWQLREAFAKYGKVSKISMGTPQGKDNDYGFCFIEMPFDNQAQVAMRELKSRRVGGNILTIKESGMII